MTQEIIEMAQECGLVGMRPHLDGIYIESLLAFAKLVADKALAEHAMREVQRLGQEIEQEPVVCPECKAVVLYECVACSSNNYPPQPEQEPVAYLCENAVGHRYFRWKKPSSTYKPLPLYITPPQRTWVGLTGLDQKELMAMSARDAVFATEAKLKEKTHESTEQVTPKSNHSGL